MEIPNPKKKCQTLPKAPKSSRKTWNEFTNLDGKLVLLKTTDFGLIKSTRKPNCPN